MREVVKDRETRWNRQHIARVRIGSDQDVPGAYTPSLLRPLCRSSWIGSDQDVPGAYTR